MADEDRLIQDTDSTRNRRPSNTEFDEFYESGGIIPENPSSSERELNSVRQQKVLWQYNYQEAAIFLEEGINNDKFKTHPRTFDALPAYALAHNKWYYLMDLLASLLLLGLIFCESPAVPFLKLPIGAHASLELFGLALLSVELGLKLRWQGVKTFFSHKRTLFKTLLLFLMFTEAIVVLSRQSNHFRVTRALRPLFLLDSHYARGVRRFVRQILQSLPPILDMIALLLFFMLIFSILGFYLFSTNPDDPFFKTIQSSFISLFVLLTTANYPDVMMPSYAQSKWSCLFFVVYLSIELYFLMSLLLAVVYDTFNTIEKTKLKKLYMHKRKACEYAFKLLVTKKHPDKIRLKAFVGFMKYYKPRKTPKEVYLIFKYLNKSSTGSLTSEEFHDIYNVCELQWKPRHQANQLWSSNFHYPFNKLFKYLNALVTSRWFDYAIYVIIAVNFVWILVETIQISVDTTVSAREYRPSWNNILFVCVYSLEAFLKILGLGVVKYFTNGWNIFDFLVTVSSVVGVFGEFYDDSFYYIMVLRPFRLLRLFKIKRRYRDVLGTMMILSNRMVSLAIVMLLSFYFFSVIGMEIFAPYTDKMVNCCKNTSVADYYTKTNSSDGFYYLNNFENVMSSAVTLFELTVVNNWFIIMEGYASVVSEWSRIYFMLFYLSMMVVMNIVVAFILEAFIFRIQYRKNVDDDMDDHAVVKLEVTLHPEEVVMVDSRGGHLSDYYMRNAVFEQHVQEGHGTVFRGERIRSKEDFSIKMYEDEVKEWIAEETEQRQQYELQMQEMRRQSQQNGLQIMQPDLIADDHYERSRTSTY
ncbi:two pore calcium channel protein 1 [Lingula anatina]|uniref:Two pore calcium channel protein 1 n=1 Tax=Lingula anatina TaxID=7574 RepID=A0A1S3H6H9_LINAN|nr:two pore calcium channel protein 1 [Lingula anatina]|eukprot:XP_013381725.1 two pore calcium channel protein 1 [Lingula anatina]